MAVSTSALLEAVLFASGEPLTKKRLGSLLDASAEDLTHAIEELRASLEGRGLALIETEDELELRTHKEASDIVQKLRENELSRDLGKAGLEALAIILYRGSATRGDVDWVRGVNSSQTIRSLLLRGLIERTEDATDKRRVQYRPTVEALAHLGVEDRSKLPRFDEFSVALTRETSTHES